MASAGWLTIRGKMMKTNIRGYEMKARVSIGRRSTTKGTGDVSISITDDASGINVVEVLMDLREFAEAITGLYACKAEISHVPTEFMVKNLGKKRETKRIQVEKPSIFDKKEAEKQILASVNASGELKDGWTLFDDGTRSQQNGKFHTVILYRFVDVPPEKDYE